MAASKSSMKKIATPGNHPPATRQLLDYLRQSEELVVKGKDDGDIAERARIAITFNGEPIDGTPMLQQMFSSNYMNGIFTGSIPFRMTKFQGVILESIYMQSEPLISDMPDVKSRYEAMLITISSIDNCLTRILPFDIFGLVAGYLSEPLPIHNFFYNDMRPEFYINVQELGRQCYLERTGAVASAPEVGAAAATAAAVASAAFGGAAAATSAIFAAPAVSPVPVAAPTPAAAAVSTAVPAASASTAVVFSAQALIANGKGHQTQKLFSEVAKAVIGRHLTDSVQDRFNPFHIVKIQRMYNVIVERGIVKHFNRPEILQNGLEIMKFLNRFSMPVGLKGKIAFPSLKELKKLVFGIEDGDAGVINSNRYILGAYMRGWLNNDSVNNLVDPQLAIGIAIGIKVLLCSYFEGPFQLVKAGGRYEDHAFINALHEELFHNGPAVAFDDFFDGLANSENDDPQNDEPKSSNDDDLKSFLARLDKH